ncbi:MAG: hypothetical protein MJ212_04510 [Alphaproteobacteria bacterium]|nr:hypothetical protein [Alphaproteobacteria bacterium]
MTSKEDILARAKKIKAAGIKRKVKEKLYMPPVVRRLITTSLIVTGALGIKGQTEDIQDQVSQTVTTTYDAFKNDMINNRVSFLQTLDSLARERVDVMSRAEKSRNVRNALNQIFGKENVPAACYRYYCGFAGFNTIRDAAEATGHPEIVEFLNSTLTNQNYCPSIISDLDAACRKLKVDNPKGLTAAQYIEKDLADERVGIGVYACVIPSSRNSSSGKHFIFIAPALNQNGEVMRDEKGRAILWEYSFNSNHVSMITGNFKPLAMTNLNQVSEKRKEVDLLMAWMEMNKDKVYSPIDVEEKLAKAERVNAPNSMYKPIEGRVH